MPTRITRERSAVADVQARMLSAARVRIRTRDVTLANGLTIQLLEAGEGEPLLLWHGSGANALTLVPIMEQLPGRHLIAPHRPGYGLSERSTYTKDNVRSRSVQVIEQLLDVCGLEQVDVAGNSMGGVWALWAALDRPERIGRIALLGTTPLLPGTTVPVPLRLLATPGLGSLLDRLMPATSPAAVRRMMAGMGEGEAIGRYPELIDCFIAANGDPVAGETAHDEFTSLIRGLAGFRPEQLFTAQDLARIRHQVLLLWGEHDPVGGTAAARETASQLPHATIEMLDGGHAPWLDEPERAGKLVRRFLDAA